MNIHGPSLGIGAAIAAISILGAFFVMGSDFMDVDDVRNQKVTDEIKTTQAQESKDKNPSLSLITSNGSPILGSTDAPIILVEFGDYQCFYCNRFFHNTESDIMKNYVETGKVKMIFKDFTIIGQDSVNAAHAAHCASEEGKFWEYHDILYTHWTGGNNGWADSEHLLEFANQVGLDKDMFNSCMSDGRYNSIIKASYSDAQELGLDGTPAFFVIGPDHTVTKIGGAQPYDVFEKIFNSKLEK